MDIIYRDFKMTPGNAKERFDLMRTRTVVVKSDKLPSGKKRTDGKRKGDLYEAYSPIGFDMHFENAVHEIIAISLSEKEGVTDIKGYLAEYKRMKDEILNLLK
jgi:hypothetical protein